VPFARLSQRFVSRTGKALGWRTNCVVRPFLFLPLIAIAKGFGKRGAAEKARFLNIAEGSLGECRYDLILSQDLGYGQNEPRTSALEETSKLLNAYVRTTLPCDFFSTLSSCRGQLVAEFFGLGG
jgi:hypothetical protein